MKKKIGIIGIIGIVLVLSAVMVSAGKLFGSQDPAVLYNHVGKYYYNLGNTDKAEELFEKAVTTDPSYAKAQYNLGVVYYAQGRNNEAATAFDESLSLNADYSRAHYSRGLLAFEELDYDTSIHHLEKALFLDSQNINIQFDLAVVHVDRFKAKEATGSFSSDALEDLRVGLSYYNAVVAIDSDFPDAASNAHVVATVLEAYEAKLG